ncbi:enoyl-CoA hydratase family protein [Streptomyces gamaensis]|uniref:Enoyl-CoA hydratase family protein n=1 Tax=Streptomyces gamaensis TaxID=1763542 RepID=A0ABW0Z8K6_9ACTN
MRRSVVTVSVRSSSERGVTTLVLDSPHNRNALSGQLMTELEKGLGAAAADADTRAVLLSHTGNTFCAGADLKEAGGAGGDPRALIRLMRTIVELPKPVVARVTGHVRAGGLGLLGACDVAVAGEGASFAFTEARLGLAPAVISLPLLRRLDARSASRYFLTGERFGAAEAVRIGLVTVAAGEVDWALAPILDGFRKASPQGLTESKRLLTEAVLRDFDTEGNRLAELSGRLFASEEAREGVTAFLERRDAAWVR